MRPLVIGLLVLGVAAGGAAAARFEATEADFACLLDWPRVEGHKARIFNKSPKRLRRALRILARGRPGRRYPVGTIIQLIPQEAMVKAGGRFNRAGRGWEFFSLRDTPSGTQILARGGEEVANVFTGASCQGCHLAARKFDLVCESGRGCVKLPDVVDADLIDRLQRGDRRCGPRP